MLVDRRLLLISRAGFICCPVLAAIAPQQISKLYGVSATDSALITLLQHRAILLGIVGLAFAVAAFSGQTLCYLACCDYRRDQHDYIPGDCDVQSRADGQPAENRDRRCNRSGSPFRTFHAPALGAFILME